MIANVASGQQFFFESINTLNFASKSKSIVNKPIVNEQNEAETIVEASFSTVPAKKTTAGSQNKENVVNMKEFVESTIQAKLSEFSKGLMSPFLRKTALDQEAVRRLERVEKRLMQQTTTGVDIEIAEIEEEEQREEAPITIPIPDTPMSKMETAKQLIHFAKEKEKKKLHEEALKFYRKASKVLDSKDSKAQIAKLEEKIKKLESLAYGTSYAPLTFDDHNYSYSTSNSSVRSSDLDISSSRQTSMEVDDDFIKPVSKPAKKEKEATKQKESNPPQPLFEPVKVTKPDEKHKKIQEDEEPAKEEKQVKKSTSTLPSKKLKVEEEEYKLEEYEEEGEKGDSSSRTTEDLLKILNNGSLEEVLDLKGVGGKRGNAIITNRPYKNPYDLQKISGFGKKFVQSLIDKFLADEESAEEDD
jgi:DNA uptake protein ComE-like DNA-binding protein